MKNEIRESVKRCNCHSRFYLATGKGKREYLKEAKKLRALSMKVTGDKWLISAAEQMHLSGYISISKLVERAEIYLEEN